MTRAASPRRAYTSEGTHRGAFTPLDWVLVAVMSMSWGSSFALIAEALEHFSPALIAFGRIAIGGVVIALVPAARRPVDRQDWPRLVLLGAIWMAVPFMLFGYAEQRIASGVAGMIVGGNPLMVALLATAMLGRLPGNRQIAGIAVGFGGIVAISVPEVADGGSSALGVGMVLVAIGCYAVAMNLAVPLQQRYGSMPVLLRMQMVATVMTAPAAAATLGSASYGTNAIVALLPLGMLGTGAAYVAMTSLSGRVGATRASIGVYLIPVVAAVIGFTIRDEDLHPAALAGTALVVLGAWMASGADGRAERDLPAPSPPA